MTDLRCPNCGASASLPLGMTCSNHRPLPTARGDYPILAQRASPELTVFGPSTLAIEADRALNDIDNLRVSIDRLRAASSPEGTAKP